MEVQIFNNSRQSQETGPWTEIKRCWIYLSAWTNNTNIPIRYAWIFNIIGPWSFVRISVETIGESQKIVGLPRRLVKILTHLRANLTLKIKRGNIAVN